MRMTNKRFINSCELACCIANTACAKTLYTTIFQIGKPNYRFWKNQIRLPLRMEFLGEPSPLGVPRLNAFGEQALAE